MKTRTFSLDFVAMNDGQIWPKDAHLHKLAVEYAERELSSKVNFPDFRKTFVTCEIDDDDKPVRVIGIACGWLMFDWPVMRFTETEAAEPLFTRIRSYLDDQGLRGQATFIHLADREPKESRCPKWRQWLRKMKATKASRWLVRI